MIPSSHPKDLAAMAVVTEKLWFLPVDG